MAATASTNAGRRPAKALSAAFVRTARSPGKYFDGHGLFLKVDDSGARRWVQRITIRGKRCELGLGSADLVTLAEARDQALENRRLARAGGDPLRARREGREVPTFAEAARKVHEIHLPTWRNAKHGAQFLSTLETYAFPRIGARKVGEVDTSDVLAVLTPIWTTRHETARRVRQRIGLVMKWAVAQGWRQDNPADSVAQALPKHDPSTVKNRKAVAHEDLHDALDRIRSSRAASITKLAFEFLVLTAARSGEVRGARWEEIDRAAAVWSVPAERMKAKRLHRVPLPPRCMEILAQAEALSDGSDLVFPGARRGRPLSDMTLLKLLKEQGVDAHVHGFRTTFKTWALERTSFANEVSEMALAHTIRNKAEAAYARSDLFEKRRELMDAWAAFVCERDK